MLWISALLLIALAGCSVGPNSDNGLDFGQNSKLTNINPDPNGEPWIAGGLEYPSEQMLNALPEADFGDSVMAGALPEFVDNTTFKQFRPIFNQYGGSCAQATAIGYIYTYEINVMRNADSSIQDNQYPSGYTWNAVNGGENNGSWMSSGWDVIKNNGIPNVTTYAGQTGSGQYYLDYSRYMTGYEKYYSGMKNSLANQFTMRTTTAAGIQTLKQWLYDHARGQFPGGLVTFACNISGASFATLSPGSSQAGKKVLTKMGTTGGHGMTIAGYDDNITYDYNGDGQITTDVDINNDGIVDVKDWEKGAVLVVNSWGSYWQDGGKVWMMYKVLADSDAQGGIWSQQVYAMNASNNPSPALAARVKIKHNGRASINITVGIATDVNATYPTKTKSFSRLLQGSGYSNMISRIQYGAIELGLDMTELTSGVDLTQPLKFFLQVYEGDYNSYYSGTIEEFAVMDYSGAAPKEYYSSQFDVPIANYTTTTLTAINDDAPVSVYKQVYFRGTPNVWDTSVMTLISNFTWSINASFSGAANDRFKFDVNGDWALNFGDNEADGIADRSGEDIFITTGAADYQILFNDRTKKYIVKKDGIPAPSGLSFTIENTNDVFLSWNSVEGADGYVISRVPSDGYAPYATAQTSHLYAGKCEFGKSYVYTVKAYTGTPFPQKYSAPVTITVANGGWKKVYEQVYFRGTANGWDSTPMTLVADNTWEYNAVFGNTSTERFKFDIYTDWTLNFGDNNGDFFADQGGKDISVPAGSAMTIRFNDLTKAYAYVAKTGTIEATPGGGNAPSSELLDMPVNLYLNGKLIATKAFILDGSSYISVRFPERVYGEYTLKVDTVKNAYRYTGTATVTVDSEHTEYVYLAVNKQAADIKKIHYYSPSWSYSYFHYQKDDGSWTAVPGLAMACGADQWCDIEVSDQNDIVFCFNDGGSNWDSKGGFNYSTSASEVWVKYGVVYTVKP